METILKVIQVFLIMTRSLKQYYWHSVLQSDIRVYLIMQDLQFSMHFNVTIYIQRNFRILNTQKHTHTHKSSNKLLKYYSSIPRVTTNTFLRDIPAHEIQYNRDKYKDIYTVCCSPNIVARFETKRSKFRGRIAIRYLSRN